MSLTSATMDLCTANLESLSKRDLEGLCRKYHLSHYGLKSQLLARLRNHRTTLLPSAHGSSAPSASSEPGSPATVSSPPAMTSTPVAPRQNPSDEASAFTPEQQAHIERLITSHMASAGTVAGPSTLIPPPTVAASAPLSNVATHGGVGESAIIIVIVLYTLLI